MIRVPETERIVSEMLRSYVEVGGINHIGGPNFPSRQKTIDILQALRSLLFPGREPEL